MAADITDKITHVALDTLTTLASPGHTNGSTSALHVADISAWPTADAVFFGIDVVGSDGKRVANTYTEWKGVISGGTITDIELINGSDQDYAAGPNTRVYMLITAAWANSIVDALTAEHSKTGTHGDVTATAVTVSGAVTAQKLNPTGAVFLDGTSDATFRHVPTSAEASAGYFTAAFPHGLGYTPWVSKAQVVDVTGAKHPMPWLHTASNDHFGSGSAVKPPDLWIEIESIDSTNINIVATWAAISGLSIVAANETAPGFQFQFYCEPQPSV